MSPRMAFVVTSRRALKRVSEVSYEGAYLRRIIAYLRADDVFLPRYGCACGWWENRGSGQHRHYQRR